jgi:hypothetical protein
MRGDGSEVRARPRWPVIRPRESEQVLGTEEALARLRVAIDLRDPLAVERILRRFSGSEDGEWLLGVCLGAALQRLGQEVVQRSDAR